jgi:hypothetical protein
VPLVLWQHSACCGSTSSSSSSALKMHHWCIMSCWRVLWCCHNIAPTLSSCSSTKHQQQQRVEDASLVHHGLLASALVLP